MTITEFKLWLEGFSHSFVEAPSPGQWKLIQDQLKQVHERVPSPSYRYRDTIGPYVLPQYPTVTCGGMSNTTNL